MLNTCGHKNKITCCKRVVRAAVVERAMSRNDDVNFITAVRLLHIFAAGFVNFKRQTAVPKQLSKGRVVLFECTQRIFRFEVHGGVLWFHTVLRDICKVICLKLIFFIRKIYGLFDISTTSANARVCKAAESNIGKLMSSALNSKEISVQPSTTACAPCAANEVMMV